MSDLNDLQRRVGEWCAATFPNATNNNIAGHLQEEVAEMIDAVYPEPVREWIEEEAADCLLLLLHLAHRNGFSLFDAAVVKMAINEKRTWTTVAPAGYVKHTEDLA